MLYGKVEKISKAGVITGSYRFKKNSTHPDDQYVFKASAEMYPMLNKKNLEFAAFIKADMLGGVKIRKSFAKNEHEFVIAFAGIEELEKDQG